MRKLYTNDSSHIHSILYDPKTKVMSVQFRVGGTYTYIDVSPVIFGTLAAAESVGQVFTRLKNQLNMIARTEGGDNE